MIQECAELFLCDWCFVYRDLWWFDRFLLISGWSKAQSSETAKAKSFQGERTTELITHPCLAGSFSWGFGYAKWFVTSTLKAKAIRGVLNQ